MTSIPVPSTVTPARIADHLSRTRWSRQEHPRTVLWTWGGGDNVQIALPADGYEGEPGNTLDAVRALAYAEKRTVEQMVADLSTPGGADTISVRLVGPDNEAGITRAGLLSHAVEAISDLVRGAATALRTTSAMPVNASALEKEYAASLRVSTSPGSFVINAALPLLPGAAVGGSTADHSLDDYALIPAEDLTPPEPFGGRVLERIRTVAVRSTALARDVNTGKSSLARFVTAPETTGTSLELAALSRLSGVEHTDDTVDPGAFDLLMTSSRAVFNEPAWLSVTPGEQRVLWRAAELLRGKEPLKGVRIEGTVVRLARELMIGPGQITIFGNLEGAPRHVIVELSESDYRDAVRAHQEDRPVEATGDVTFAGTRTRMTDATFVIVPSLI